MLLSKQYIRKEFMKCGVQMSEEALDILCDKLKEDVQKYAMNAKDLVYKRLVKVRVPIIIGDFENV